MSRYGGLTAIALSAMVVAGSTQAWAGRPTASSTAEAARTTVGGYFQALESGHYRTACTLLGARLLVETGGSRCPSFLRVGMPDPLRWRILGVRSTRGSVGVVVRLGQNELDHVRMRTWLAIVRDENGSPKIVETRLLA